MTHWLVIEEQGEDYTIEHEPDCPQEKGWEGPGGEPIMFHTCLLGALITDAGLDTLENAPDDSWKNLPAGRYEIKAWAQHYPSTPVSGEEWDAGIALVIEGAL
jgi:hypothetical protein